MTRKHTTIIKKWSLTQNDDQTNMIQVSYMFLIGNLKQKTC